MKKLFNAFFGALSVVGSVAAVIATCAGVVYGLIMLGMRYSPWIPLAVLVALVVALLTVVFYYEGNCR